MGGKSLSRKIKIGFLFVIMLFLGVGVNMLYSSVQPVDALKVNEDFNRLLLLANENDALIQSLVPPGTVLIYPVEQIPSGFYECDGRAVSRNEHLELFEAIGTMYGAGDGSSTFNLPDYRGYFLRGLDNGAGRDPDANARDYRPDGVGGDNMGTTQDDDFESHTHLEDAKPGYSSYGGAGTGANWFAVRGTSQTEASGGVETRPKNIAVVYIIKAR